MQKYNPQYEVSYINGQSYQIQLDPTTGATILGPVEMPPKETEVICECCENMTQQTTAIPYDAGYMCSACAEAATILL